MLICKSISYFIRHTTHKQIILKNFNQNFEKNRVYYLSTPSGSGKSTLLALLARCIEPTDGTIFFQNKPIQSIPKEIYWKNFVSYLPQKPFLPSFAPIKSFIETNGITNKKEKELFFEKIREILEISNTTIASTYDILSGGEKGRVALLITLLKRNKILILDEPIAHCHSKLAEKIIEYIDTYTRENGIITIIADHRMKNSHKNNLIYFH